MIRFCRMEPCSCLSPLRHPDAEPVVDLSIRSARGNVRSSGPGPSGLMSGLQADVHFMAAKGGFGHLVSEKIHRAICGTLLYINTDQSPDASLDPLSLRH